MHISITFCLLDKYNFLNALFSNNLYVLFLYTFPFYEQLPEFMELRTLQLYWRP